MSENAPAIAAALAKGSMFGVFGEDACRRLAAAGSPIDLISGAVLFQTGDPGDAAYLILAGELEVRTQSIDGREVRISGLGPGALVGEMAALDGEPRSADVAAARNSRLWRFPRAALIDALEADPKAALALLAELSRRLRGANAALEAGRLLDLGGRLAQLLIAQQSGQGVVSMTQTEMARRLGFSREKVNRKLHQWAEAGWVEMSAAGVRVVNAVSLTRRPD